MSFINGSSVKNPIETGSLANTAIRKPTGLFKPVNMFSFVATHGLFTWRGGTELPWELG